MERLYTSNVSISNGNINARLENPNLPLKLFRATVANTDTGSRKSLHTFLKNVCTIMLVKCEQTRMVQTARNFELFDKINK